MACLFWRTLVASVLLSVPAFVVPVVVPDCIVEGSLFERDGLKRDIAYHCRVSLSLTFEVTESAAAPYVSGLKVERTDGVGQAHYRFDLLAFARAIDPISLTVVDGTGVLATLGSWLREPRGYKRPPIIDIRMTSGPGLAFATRLPKAGDVWRPAGTTARFAGYTALDWFAYREPAVGSVRTGQPKSLYAVPRVRSSTARIFFTRRSDGEVVIVDFCLISFPSG